jgi:hypothetical protein
MMLRMTVTRWIVLLGPMVIGMTSAFADECYWERRPNSGYTEGLWRKNSTGSNTIYPTKQECEKDGIVICYDGDNPNDNGGPSGCIPYREAMRRLRSNDDRERTSRQRNEQEAARREEESRRRIEAEEARRVEEARERDRRERERQEKERQAKLAEIDREIAEIDQTITLLETN